MIKWCVPQVAFKLISQRWCFTKAILPQLLFTPCFCLRASTPYLFAHPSFPLSATLGVTTADHGPHIYLAQVFTSYSLPDVSLASGWLSNDTSMYGHEESGSRRPALPAEPLLPPFYLYTLLAVLAVFFYGFGNKSYYLYSIWLGEFFMSLIR